MAQRWKVPNEDDFYLEFALTDCGTGFFREVRRAGLDIESDRDAIAWCIQEGHTTKGPREDDGWAQRMPGDMMVNPLRGIERARVGENHHAGLGLYKLTELVGFYRGTLWLGSGSQLLKIRPDGTEWHGEIENWDGVAIACRFRMSAVENAGDRADDNQIEELARLLGQRGKGDGD